MRHEWPPNCSKRTKVDTCTLSAKKPSIELRRGDVFARRLDAHSPVSAVPARSASGLVGPLAMNLPNANDCCRAPAALANEAPVAQDGPYPSPELVPSQPGRSRGRTHRHAISVPFRARRHRFVTVSHGHSRSSDLQRPYYRCVAARMVRMGSLDRPLGPHRGHTPPESHGQHRTTAATQHRSSAVLLDQHRRSTDHPTWASPQRRDTSDERMSSWEKLSLIHI